MAPKATKAGGSTRFSDRDMELLPYLILCGKNALEIDVEKFVAMSGLKNKQSAATTISTLKRKIKECDPTAGTGSGTTCAASNGINKGAKKAAGKGGIGAANKLLAPSRPTTKKKQSTATAKAAVTATVNGANEDTDDNDDDKVDVKQENGDPAVVIKDEDVENEEDGKRGQAKPLTPPAEDGAFPLPFGGHEHGDTLNEEGLLVVQQSDDGPIE